MDPTTFVNFVKLEVKDTHEPVALESVEIKNGVKTEYVVSSEQGFVALDKLQNNISLL